MGRLVGLELHNFKSYKGTTSVGFGTAEFTSIIGPNGSGKSNMMDAISFVLGVRSSQLRSSNLKDLIYRGRISDDDQTTDEEDLERAYVLAVYEKTNGEILELKRTITASGNSEYRINNKVISAIEYSNILKTENILIKAKNFLVFQGDVEAIASQSATELSKMIETISGSSSHKKEYDLLKDQQDDAKQQTASIISKRRTLMSEVKQYKEQRHEAELYQSKLQEKNKTIQLLNLWKLYHIDLKRDQYNDNIGETKTLLKKIKQKINKEEINFKNLKSQYAKESLKIENFSKKISSKKSQIKSKREEQFPIEAQKEVSQKKINSLNKRVKDITADATRQTQYVSNVENQIKVVKKAKSQAEKEFHEKAGISQVSIEDQKEYDQLKQKYLSEGGGSSEEEKLSLLLADKLEIESALELLQNQKNVSNDHVEELQIQQDDLKQKLITISNELNEINESISNKKQILKALNLQSQNFFTKEFEINSKLREVLIQLDDLNANQRETHKETKLRENVNTLRRLFPGVIGLLSDLCQPKEKKFELAVSSILGKNFDAIIVENSSVGQQCITYLKEQRSGVASFIPLDSIDGKPIDSRLRHLDTGSRPTIDVVAYEPYLERAIQFACGNSIICDDIQIAKDIRWNKRVDVKVVTVDGSLIHKAGLMTGGKSKNSERRWNKTEVQTLTKLKDELSSKLNDLHNNKPDPFEIKNIELELVSLDTSSAGIRRQRVELERALIDSEAEIKYYTEDKLLEEKKKLEQDKLDQLNEKIFEQETIIANLQSDIFKSFCSRLKIKSVKDYEIITGSQLRTQSKELKQYANELLKLDKKLDFEKERLNETQERISKINKDISKHKNIIKDLNQDLEEIKNSLDILESELEVFESDLKEFEKSIEDKLTSTKKQEEILNELLDKEEDLKRSLEINSEEVEKTIVEKISILKNCKIENVQIPIIGSNTSLDDLPLESNEKLVDLMNSLKIDFSELSNKYKTTNNSNISKELEEKIDGIIEQLSTLSPNIKAIERLTEVSSNLETLEKEFQRVRNNELTIVKQFQEIKNKRYELFINAFNHISDKIDPVYKELTNPNFSTTLGGGSAYLTLEDEDEPYLSGIRYHAMPPMKRFKDMEFLSGGEKTIAALALLFAIHSFNPSPFFVLDEVDAALDNLNVSKIANYILNNSGPNLQFIVISLKNSLFEKSDSLVGIYRDRDENSSKTVTLDLRNYPETVTN
ncbi:hypothetical protein WICMUC_001239 [Wickerhamomyces mucosus]|uniref:Structural maintenance of chromosomes protein n=1 Tax=Wickerhamomyces mucosus TaxID=1378264 RepID=A0A9P8PXA7_9ASCO|nr:hypothetical protein WICMUC_001239 [Wickerhamomyces mucosus]